MNKKYNFGSLVINEPKIIDYPVTDKQKLIFYIRSSWTSYKRYNNLDWKLKFRELEFGVEILRVK